MARTTAVFVPNATPQSATATELELTDIPRDIREEVEAIYVALLAAPAGRMHIEFDTVQELQEYVRYAQGYCLLRPAGQIRFRKSPVKGKETRPDTHLDFKVTDLLTKDEETTANVRQATVKAGGSDGTPKALRPVVAAAKAAKVTAPAKVTPAAMPAKRPVGRPRKNAR